MPVLESLERLELLTSANIASFTGPLVTVPNNSKSGYALPGMQVQIRVDIATLGGQYVGIKRLDFAYEGLSTYSIYTTELGDPRPEGGALFSYSDLGPTSFTHIYYAPKTLGPHTISVDVVARKFSWTGGQFITIDDTFTDTLQLTVEAPRVDTFYVEGEPARFDTMDDNGNNGTVGIGILTKQENNHPGFTFHATVTNSTHYDAWIGFIQGFKPDRSLTFWSHPAARFQTSDYMWDTAYAPNPAGLWYFNQQNIGYWLVMANSQPFELQINGDHLDDSPAQGGIPVDDQGHRLRAVSMHDSFETHLTVKGGERKGEGMPVPGLPIGLSTATWEAGGSGTTTESEPILIMNPALWNKGPLTPSTTTSYPGDGVIKYLRWKGNGPKALENFKNSTGRGGIAVAGHSSLGTLSFVAARHSGISIFLELWPGPLFDTSTPFLTNATDHRKKPRSWV